MRRADRLFQIVQLLRGRTVVTAAELARELEVSQRTIYRDVQDLIGSGVPIEGIATKKTQSSGASNAGTIIVRGLKFG